MNTRHHPLATALAAASVVLALTGCDPNRVIGCPTPEAWEAAAGARAAERRAEQRERVLAIARSYAELEWRATDANVLHGPAADEVRVETPDAGFRADGFRTDGTPNRGVPYKWGGFSTIEEFLDGVERGLAAGDLPTKGSDRSSAGAVGVDCSGFVSRCWELPLKQSTRSLGRLCYALESWDELAPGDLLNSDDGHAQVFVGWADEAREHVRVIEAAFPFVAENEYPVAQLRERGMVPLRYKPLDPRWEELPLAAARIATEPTFDPPFVAAGEPVDLGPRVGVLAGAAHGDWARFVEREEGAPESAREITRALRRDAEDRLALRFLTTVDGGTLPTEEAVAGDTALVELLLDFAGSGQRPARHEVLVATRQDGTARLDGRALTAERLRYGLQVAYVVRGTEYRRWLELDCVRTDALPLEGVLWLRTTLRRTREDAEGAAHWVAALTAAGGPSTAERR